MVHTPVPSPAGRYTPYSPENFGKNEVNMGRWHGRMGPVCHELLILAQSYKNSTPSSSPCCTPVNFGREDLCQTPPTNIRLYGNWFPQENDDTPKADYGLDQGYHPRIQSVPSSAFLRFDDSYPGTPSFPAIGTYPGPPSYHESNEWMGFTVPQDTFPKIGFNTVNLSNGQSAFHEISNNQQQTGMDYNDEWPTLVSSHKVQNTGFVKKKLRQNNSFENLTGNNSTCHEGPNWLDIFINPDIAEVIAEQLFGQMTQTIKLTNNGDFSLPIDKDICNNIVLDWRSPFNNNSHVHLDFLNGLTVQDIGQNLHVFHEYGVPGKESIPLNIDPAKYTGWFNNPLDLLQTIQMNSNSKLPRDKPYHCITFEGSYVTFSPIPNPKEREPLHYENTNFVKGYEFWYYQNSRPWFLDLNSTFPRNVFIYFRKKKTRTTTWMFFNSGNDSFYTSLNFPNGNLTIGTIDAPSLIANEKITNKLVNSNDFSVHSNQKKMRQLENFLKIKRIDKSSFSKTPDSDSFLVRFIISKNGNMSMKMKRNMINQKPKILSLSMGFYVLGEVIDNETFDLIKIQFDEFSGYSFVLQRQQAREASSKLVFLHIHNFEIFGEDCQIDKSFWLNGSVTEKLNYGLQLTDEIIEHLIPPLKLFNMKSDTNDSHLKIQNLNVYQESMVDWFNRSITFHLPISSNLVNNSHLGFLKFVCNRMIVDYDIKSINVTQKHNYGVKMVTT
jgi:hypothetical protein